MKCARVILITLLALPIPTWAAAFILNVPVNINNLPPDITELRVVCGVETEPFTYMAKGFTVITIPSSGSYNDTVRVETHFVSGMARAIASSYRCQLWASDTLTVVNQIDRFNPLYMPPPGVANVLIVRGSMIPGR